MRIVEYKGERFLVLESEEDVEKFREMLIKAYYELNRGRKSSRKT